MAVLALRRVGRAVLLCLLFLYSCFWVVVVAFCAIEFARKGTEGVKNWLMSVSSNLAANPKPTWEGVLVGLFVVAAFTLFLWVINWRFLQEHWKIGTRTRG